MKRTESDSEKTAVQLPDEFFGRMEFSAKPWEFRAIELIHRRTFPRNPKAAKTWPMQKISLELTKSKITEKLGNDLSTVSRQLPQ